jgi:hypothetical protein
MSPEIKGENSSTKRLQSRQTCSRPTTIEAGLRHFSHDGKAQYVLTNLRRRVLFVSCVTHLFGFQWASLVEVAISLRIVRCHLVPFVSPDNVLSGYGAAADLHQRSKTRSS